VVSSSTPTACGQHAGGVNASPAARFGAELSRSTHGAVRMKGDGFRRPGYGLVYAYGQDNACLRAGSLPTIRGKRSLCVGRGAPARASKVLRQRRLESEERGP